MKLYTRTGDDGTTGLFGGVRVPKTDLRIRAAGEVDELNAALGLAAAGCPDDALLALLRRIQSDLFMLGAEISTGSSGAGRVAIGENHVAELERWIDEASGTTPLLRNFILPGGTTTAAALHLARAVCRRAERAVVRLSTAQAVGSAVLKYLNRLSDLLFALARQANHQAGVSEVPWVAPTETRP